MPDKYLEKTETPFESCIEQGKRKKGIQQIKTKGNKKVTERKFL